MKTANQSGMAGFTLAVVRLHRMVTFCANVFNVSFKKELKQGTQMYRGGWNGMNILFCPASIPKNNKTDEQMKKYLFCFLIIAVSIQQVKAQSFFEKITASTWRGSGTLFENEATFHMNWEQVLDGKFYRLTFQNQMGSSKRAVLKAIGFYQVKQGGTFKGTWFDSRGMSFPLNGKFTEEELTVFWGSPETEEGKTIYTIETENNISVTDYVLKNNEFVVFGKANYTSSSKKH